MVAEAHDLAWLDAQELARVAHLERLLDDVDVVLHALLDRRRSINAVVWLLGSLLFGTSNLRELALFPFVFNFDLHWYTRLSAILDLDDVAVLVFDLFVFGALVFALDLLSVVVPARVFDVLLSFLFPFLSVDFGEHLFFDSLHLADIVFIDLDALGPETSNSLLKLFLRFFGCFFSLQALSLSDLGEARCLALLRADFFQLLLLGCNYGGLLVAYLFDAPRLIEPIVPQRTTKRCKMNRL